MNLKSSIRYLFAFFLAFSAVKPSWGGENWTTLTTAAPVRNQCDSRTCFAHATISVLDILASEKYQTPISFSIDYLLLQYLLWKAFANFIGHKTPYYTGQLNQAFALSLEYGLVPNRDWSSKVSLAAIWGDVVKKIENLVEVRRGKISENDFLAEAKKLLYGYTGTPPEMVTVGERTLTREELAKEIIPYIWQWRVLLSEGVIRFTQSDIFSPYGSQNIRTKNGEIASIYKIVDQAEIVSSTSPENATEIAASALKQNYPVLLAFASKDANGNRTYNESNREFFESTMGPQSTYQRAHVVLAMGTRRSNDDLLEFKIQDSRGIKDGINGFRTMPASFLVQHGLDAIIFAAPWSCKKALTSP